ncbi:hypothetical protein BX667DRAFT_280537 [Coemansia mojavensis]|nr:hypothetical protein BX667DRAFT_280537 [Coemansia mojavensis]
MAHFSTIPDDIHRLIIDELFYKDWLPANVKKNLYLLAINHTWRQLALPLVYSKAYICYGKDGTQSDTDNVLDTTIELIPHGNLIKDVFIKLRYHSNLIPGLDRVIELLGCGATRLKLVMKPTVDKGDGELNTAELAQAADRLVAALPSVSVLDYAGVSKKSATGVLLGYIAGRYANQLTALTSNISFATESTFTQLKTIDFVKEYPDQVQKINPEHLTKLTISNSCPTMMWGNFQLHGNGGDIVFPNLKQLTIHNLSNSSLHYFQFRLVFPRLASLFIFGTSPILSQLKLPTYLESITIKTSGSVYKQLQDVVLPTADNIELSDIWESDYQTLTCMNRLLRNGGKKASLSFYNPYITITADQLTCEHFSILLLHARVNISTLLEIVKLPNLHTLTLYSVINSSDEDILELTSSLDPFTSPIKQLALNYIDCPHGLMVKATTSLVLRMPQLKRLTAHQIDDIKLDSYVSEYPHIAGIKCLFKPVH